MADGTRTDFTNSFSCLMDKCHGKEVECEDCPDFELDRSKCDGRSF